MVVESSQGARGLETFPLRIQPCMGVRQTGPGIEHEDMLTRLAVFSGHGEVTLQL